MPENHAALDLTNETRVHKIYGINASNASR